MTTTAPLSRRIDHIVDDLQHITTIEDNTQYKHCRSVLIEASLKLEEHSTRYIEALKNASVSEASMVSMQMESLLRSIAEIEQVMICYEHTSVAEHGPIAWTA